MLCVPSFWTPGGSRTRLRACGRGVTPRKGIPGAVDAAEVYGRTQTDPDHARGAGLETAPTADGGGSDLPVLPWGLCRLAAASQSDIRPCPAQLATRANAFQGSNFYRINDLLETVEEWQQAATLKYKSGMHLGTLALAGWSNAAFGGPNQRGAMPPGYSIGLLPAFHSWSSPCSTVVIGGCAQNGTE